jgi:hypothetical protein
MSEIAAPRSRRLVETFVEGTTVADGTQQTSDPALNVKTLGPNPGFQPSASVIPWQDKPTGRDSIQLPRSDISPDASVAPATSHPLNSLPFERQPKRSR